VTATEIAKCAASEKADLIVMGRCRSTVATGFLGSTAERVIRRARRAVLVVRPAVRGRYKRPAVAIDTGNSGENAVRHLLRMLPPPRPAVTLIHAYDTPYAGMYRHHHSDEAAILSEHRRSEASRDIDRMLMATLARSGVPESEAPRWEYVIRGGSPREIVAKVVEKRMSDILVLSTRGRSGIAYAYLGSVAGDLLRSVECDVLVAPARR
jgi:nucleotide-binding universal stress UspA family protein